MSDDLRSIRACIDRKVPPKPTDERMALVKGSLWAPGDAIRVSFMNGDAGVQNRVKDVASAWMVHANLRFLFVSDDDAEIRISFDEEGSWSYLGIDCKSLPLGQPTMNYGWLTRDSSDDEVQRVVLHEFGHALGCIHEHQNPAAGIEWNKPVVYEYYGGPPNNWSTEDVDHNLFEVYDEDLTVHTETDADSIMMYPIDARFTLNGFSAEFNASFSERDKQFIKECYPQ